MEKRIELERRGKEPNKVSHGNNPSLNLNCK